MSRTMLDYIEMMVWVYSEICLEPIWKKKEITEIFKSFELSIIVTTNVASANYLENNFDLTKDIYKPYMKPNGEPVYIIRHSNHPPSIVQKIPL